MCNTGRALYAGYRVTELFSRLYSFKFLVTVALLWLGALAYGLAIYSTQVYRGHAVESHTESLQTLLELKSREVIDDLFLKQMQYARRLQSEAPFQAALRSGDAEAMRTWLGESYSNYQATDGNLKLKSIIVRDTSGEVFAQSSDDGIRARNGCPDSLTAIGGLLALLKPKSHLCSFDGEPFSDVVLPVGENEPQAYLQIVAYTLDELIQIEPDIGIPLQITNSAGRRLYQSDKWVNQQSETYLYPDYRLYGDDDSLAAMITAASDQQAFINRLRHTETNFFVITTIATVSALLLVMVLLNRAFLPMKNLRNSVGALLTGKYSPISEDKLPNELRDLVIAYNEMVEGLEVETITRRQMEEKLRSEKDFISTTLDSITNPVIVIDSKHQIKLVNPGAEKLFGEPEAELIDVSIHDVLILFANRQATRIVDIRQLLNRQVSISSMYFYDANRHLVELEFSASPMIDMVAEDVGYVIILKDVSEDRKLRRKLSYEGSHDQLTRFLNRNAFESRFESLITEDDTVNTQHAIAYLNIDGFSMVNEACGSTAGDLLLKQVGSIIKSQVRKSDILSRLSGDEFGIIMPFFEMENALQTIQKIIIEIQHTPFVWNEQEYFVTASIGVMNFGAMNDIYSEIYSKITTACSLAKKNGGNQYHFIDENDKKVLAQQESMEWVSGIMEGIAEDRFCLYVQPIVPMDDSDQSPHYEVLIRYRSPDGRIVSPGDFLPPAERYNLIERIDVWVVTNVLSWLQRNQQQHPDIQFSINLSGRSIGSQTFHNFLRETLSTTSVDLRALCFEITETAVVDNVERSVEFIKSIKALGAKFSLDDFGSGLSSFGYLKQFPVDYLKIDGEFIRDIIDDEKSFVFVRSMTEVGHCLNMKVIAEFVESDSMFEKLRLANVDFIQGFTVGKPVDIETLCNVAEIPRQTG